MFSTTSVVEFDALDRNVDFHRGCIIVECAPYSGDHALQEKCIRAAFGDVKKFRFEPSEGDNSESSPEIWKNYWSSRVAGDDGPWICCPHSESSVTSAEIF